MTCGEKISRLRKSKGMTQEDLGKILNVTYQAVSKWERGESLPDFETMSQIAKIFQVPISYFEEGENALSARGTERPAPASSYENVAGVCTVCGKMLKENEVFQTVPKMICKPCAERQRRARIQAQQAEAEQRKAENDKRLRETLGAKFDIKLVISLIVALALYILFTVLTFQSKTDDEELGYAVLLFIVPLAGFACVHALADFINDLRDKDLNDDTEGYRRNLSLITAGGFAVANAAFFLILRVALNSPQSNYYLLFLFAGSVLSFTFISQFMWGGAVKEIFTCGGLTFKMPGFIFSLSIDSILLMIIVKFFLGVLSVILFVVTTILLAVLAIVGSVFLFIPSVIRKTAKDNKARAENG